VAEMLKVRNDTGKLWEAWHCDVCISKSIYVQYPCPTSCLECMVELRQKLEATCG
jgi:hypothetical protein